MKPEIFLDWYTNYFWSTVLHFCQENELPTKTLKSTQGGGERIRRKASYKIYENKWSTAQLPSHGDPYWWALWHWPWLGAKYESKKSVMVSIWPYSEILKERIRKLDSNNSSCSLKKKKRLNQRLHQKSQISALCHNQKISKQGHYSEDYKNFGLVFKHIKVNAQILIFYLIICSLFILYYI